MSAATSSSVPPATMGGMETERKFLVLPGADYKSVSVRHHHILQGYFAVQGATVRVRRRDDEAFLTIKAPPQRGDGLSRYEYEVPLAPTDAEQLLRLCVPPMIEKTRWIVPMGQHLFEVDEFHGDNEGLVIAEVELHSEDESFLRPPFIGQEVTGQRQYYNAQLRRFPYKLWKITTTD